MRTILGLAAMALLAFVTAAPFSPTSYPSEDAACGQNYVGVLRGGQSGGDVLVLTVVVACKEEPRFGFSFLGLKCSPERKEIRFYKTQDRSKDYTISEPVYNQTCCSGKTTLTNRKQRKATQICAGRR